MIHLQVIQIHSLTFEEINRDKATINRYIWKGFPVGVYDMCNVFLYSIDSKETAPLPILLEQNLKGDRRRNKMNIKLIVTSRRHQMEKRNLMRSHSGVLLPRITRHLLAHLEHTKRCFVHFLCTTVQTSNVGVKSSIFEPLSEYYSIVVMLRWPFCENYLNNSKVCKTFKFVNI